VISQPELERRIEDLVAEVERDVAQQEMTPLERTVKAWQFQEPDRLPGAVAVFSPRCVDVKEFSTRDYVNDPWAFYYVQALSAAKWGNEVPLLYCDPYHVEIEAMGGEVVFPEDSEPYLGRPLLEDRADLSQLRVPDPYSDGRMPMHIELARLHKRYLGSLLFAPVSCCGPFSMAVGLRGYKQILRDIREDPLFVHELSDFCCEVVKAYGQALRDVHGVSPTMQAAWCCLPHVSPRIFHEFCLPYIARSVEALRVPETGASGTLYHGYGMSLAPDWHSFLRTVCATGISALPLLEEDVHALGQYKRVDVREYKRICASQGVVVMSVVHTDTMQDATPQRIRELVHEWFRAMGKGGGYMATTSWPVEAPKENVRAFVEAVRECRYPVEGDLE
jgi:uroporphyrinogen decarboxylase